MHVRDYIKKPLEPFRRGDSDCFAFAMGWAEELAEQPVARDICKEMTTGEAIKLMHEHGGFVGFLCYHLADIGFYRVSNFEDGDIMVMEDDTAFFSQAIGVVSAGKLVSKSEHSDLRITNIEKDKVKGVWRWV